MSQGQPTLSKHNSRDEQRQLMYDTTQELKGGGHDEDDEVES